MQSAVEQNLESLVFLFGLQICESCNTFSVTWNYIHFQHLFILDH